ncbi:MAG: CBS domain-containing protein [Actinobacteria bacterium]|nr:CBS domain-containing protein [Actinomycetota bacterium]
MKINEIMTKDPETAQVTDSIMDVASMMRDLNVGFMPIMDGDMLVGCVTDRDITIRAVAEGMDTANASVGEIMSTELHVVSPDTDLDDAAHIMEEFQIRRLPVVNENGNLVGVVSLGDIAVRTKELEEAGEILEVISEPSRPERPEIAA